MVAWRVFGIQNHPYSGDFQGGLGTMGFAPACSPGSANCMITTGRYILCGWGDGGIQMTFQELGYQSCRPKAPVKVVIVE